MWFLFAASSAFLYAFRGVLEKKIITRTNRHILGLGIRLFALPFFFIPFLFRPDLLVPLSGLGSDFWLPLILIACVATPLETIFYYQALNEEELTLALPILSLAPILTLAVAAGFMDEYPTIWGIVGVLLILGGIYALKINHLREGILAPLKHLKKSRGVRFMLVVMTSQGIAVIFDKMAVKASNAFFYSAANYLLICCSLFIMARLKARGQFWQLSKSFWPFSVLGMFVAGYTLFYNLALETGITSYVIAIKNSSIIFSIIFGIILLREKGARAKLLAGALIFLGLICIKILG